MNHHAVRHPALKHWLNLGVRVAVLLQAVWVHGQENALQPDFHDGLSLSASDWPDISGPLPAGHFEPVWGDEFDGKFIDQSKWIIKQIHEDYWPETPWRRNYKRANAYIEKVDGAPDGALVLRTQKDAKPTKGKTTWSSGCIQTGDFGKKTLFQQAFGRFEARLRFPRQQGHWCAFWLMSEKVGQEDGSGRDGTEIDILEKARLGDWVNHALHWDGYGQAHQSQGHDVRDQGLGLDDGGWHIVRLDWYPDRYVFYIDGVETWRSNAGGVSQAPAFIILSEEIGNFGQGPDAWGTGPIQEASLPDYFMVDWVRVGRWVAD